MTLLTKSEFAHGVTVALKKMIPTSRVDSVNYAQHQESPHFAERVANLANKLACDIELPRINTLDN